MIDHPILKWWPVIGGFTLAAIGYGTLLSDVSNLKDRVKTLEDRTNDVRTLKTGKGDLCLKMLDEWGNTKDSKRQDDLWKRWTASDCEGAVPAAMYFPKNEVTNAN